MIKGGPTSAGASGTRKKRKALPPATAAAANLLQAEQKQEDQHLQEDKSPPPAQPSTSPEMNARKRKKITSAASSSSSSCDLIYGSPVLGLAVGRFRDRRKTRPLGILTALDSSHSTTPSIASVQWLATTDDAGTRTTSSFEFPILPPTDEALDSA